MPHSLNFLNLSIANSTLDRMQPSSALGVVRLGCGAPMYVFSDELGLIG